MAVIFAIDDEIDFLKIYDRLLHKKHGHTLLMCCNPVSLLVHFDLAEFPDLLITDFNMPEMNGGDVVRRVRDKGYTGPILMISSTRDVPPGVDRKLGKPFDNDEVVRVVGELLAARS